LNRGLRKVVFESRVDLEEKTGPGKRTSPNRDLEKSHLRPGKKFIRPSSEESEVLCSFLMRANEPTRMLFFFTLKILPKFEFLSVVRVYFKAKLSSYSYVSTNCHYYVTC